MLLVCSPTLFFHARQSHTSSVQIVILTALIFIPHGPSSSRGHMNCLPTMHHVLLNGTRRCHACSITATKLQIGQLNTEKTGRTLTERRFPMADTVVIQTRVSVADYASHFQMLSATSDRTSLSYLSSDTSFHAVCSVIHTYRGFYLHLSSC